MKTVLSLPTRALKAGRTAAMVFVLVFEVFAGGMGLRAATHFRWQNLEVHPNGQAGFSLLRPDQTAVRFTNILHEFSGATNRILHNGAGVAVGDYDGDGRPDIFSCGLDSPSALYRNLGGWTFTNATESSGIRFTNRYQRGAVFADVNGDSAMDLLVSTLNEGVICFLNDGRGRFKDVTAEAGTGSRLGSVTMALADIDGNGTLDLYVANNRGEDIRNRGRLQVFMRDGKYVIPEKLKDRLVVINGVVREYGEGDVLYTNDGGGRFAAGSWTDGRFQDQGGQALKRQPLDWGQTVVMRDMNGDGSPDIYVCNDYWTEDRMWFNDGKGTFRSVPTTALGQVCFSSMGVDFADIDRDGDFDFLVTDMQSRDRRLRKRQIMAFNPEAPPVEPGAERRQIMRNTLFLNRGDGTYADITEFAGLASSDWAWQQLFLDVDLDGYEDLLISAGYFRDVQDRDAIAEIAARSRPIDNSLGEAEYQAAFCREKMLNARLYPPYELPIIAFRNGGGRKFEEVTGNWGTDQPGIRQGFACGDLDGDGDMDLVVNCFNGPLGIYRNNSSAGRVAVRLRGLAPNTQGIGAKVRLLNGAVPMQSQEMICGGRYLSGSEARLVFATGSAREGMNLEVTWRSGKRSVIPEVAANRLYEIDESGAAEPPPFPASGREQPLFEDVSHLLGHIHTDAPFEDFSRQPLLPRKLSQPGPGVAWWDLNGDDRQDLIIGSGTGGRLAMYLNNERGGFSPATNVLTTATVGRDQTGVLGWTAHGKVAVFAGMANYEDARPEGAGLVSHDWRSDALTSVFPAQSSSTGPVVMGDIEGDGDLDLFVGGRVIGGRWPEPASSHVLRNDNGEWVPEVLEKAGLVSGAVFSDLDGDGLPELVLACEWGPIRVFGRERGRWAEQTEGLGLADLTGWWNGVTTGDLNGDGRLDIVASNWGLNTPYQASTGHPAEVYWGELGGLGVMDVVEAEYHPELKAYAPRRFKDALTGSLPFVGQFRTHKAYSEANIEAVLGESLSRARVARATTLASTVFLNRGGRFEAVAMPDEAQYSPAFGVVVNDFNGDGQEDVFLSQNFFGNEPGTPHYDAGRGLLLEGDGKGGLRAVPGQKSGLMVYGEQRGAAAADFDGDGRVDLVVGQNGGRTRLYRNAGARAGLRVRLEGPAGNPAGIGAVIRLKHPGGYGPAREVHGGSGYLSQDGALQVLVKGNGPTRLWVRWPGGAVTEAPIGADAGSTSVRQPKGLPGAK